MSAAGGLFLCRHPAPDGFLQRRPPALRGKSKQGEVSFCTLNGAVIISSLVANPYSEKVQPFIVVIIRNIKGQRNAIFLSPSEEGKCLLDLLVLLIINIAGWRRFHPGAANRSEILCTGFSPRKKKPRTNTAGRYKNDGINARAVRYQQQTLQQISPSISCIENSDNTGFAAAAEFSAEIRVAVF